MIPITSGLNSSTDGKNVRSTLPSLQSFNGGFVDTAGYLALQGLFTAHVTGNFVTIGASLVFGTSGLLAKLLALPVFCATVFVTRIFSFRMIRSGWRVLETMLTVQFLILLLGSVLAIRWGPFNDGDLWNAVLTGMVLVASMAIQNAIHRIHLGPTPPTTLMTGTTTQIMVDLADVAGGWEPNKQADVTARLKRMSAVVLLFAAGAAAAALLYHWIDVWCFSIPPMVAAAARISANSFEASPPTQASATFHRPPG
jgi:uncharacterized membrane protein YoaK (UPF0700 family)